LICCIDYTRHSVEEVIIKMEVSVWASWSSGEYWEGRC
jgi:hypothetical protein